MFSLIATLVIVIACFFLAKDHPFLAGLLAVVPVKILSMVVFSLQEETLYPAIKGMLIGQFFWGFLLLGSFLFLQSR